MGSAPQGLHATSITTKTMACVPSHNKKQNEEKKLRKKNKNACIP
jgi:hypothetical protein